MAWRFGTGPVFAWEWLRSSRKWTMYAARSIFVAILLAALTFVWSDQVSGRSVTFRDLARVGATFFVVIAFVQLIAVIFVAPALTAGAICLEKTRGTLSHLLVTDLSSAEIVLGKLAARLIPIVGLIACSLPIVALTTLLGGVDPVVVTGTYCVTFGTAVLAAALALAFSVWGSKIHEVLVATYLAIIAWFAAPYAYVVIKEVFFGRGGQPFPDWMLLTNPPAMMVIPIEDRGRAGPYPFIHFGTQVGFLMACAMLALILAAVAMVRIRSVAARDGVRRVGSGAPVWWRFVAAVVTFPARIWPVSALSRLTRRFRFDPTLDGNPVLWREWHRRRPTRSGRAIGWTFVTLALFFSGLSVANGLIKNQGEEIAGIVNGLQVGLGLLLVVTLAVTSLSEERARGSLDVLLVTDLSTREVVLGKWLAAFRSVPPLAILAAVVAFGVSDNDDGRFLIGPPLIFGLTMAQGAMVVSMGLFTATRVGHVGRALGWAVAAYVLLAMAWPLLVLAIADGEDPGVALAMLSPIVGAGASTLMTADEGPDRFWPWCILAGLGWMTFCAVTAWRLLMRTECDFDAEMGRVPAPAAHGSSWAAAFGPLDVRFRLLGLTVHVSNATTEHPPRLTNDGNGSQAEGRIDGGRVAPESLTGSGWRTP